MYSITQFAKLTGYHIKTLQKWDRDNILKPEGIYLFLFRIYTDKQRQFKQYVIYKSVKYNKEVILVDERNTSKTCSCCGKIKYYLTLSERVYNCLSCGNSIDRDRNAAINMKLLGSSILNKIKVVTELE